MTKFAIQTIHLSKSYRVKPESHSNYKNMHEDAIGILKRLLKRHKEKQRTFWALQDCNIKIEKGEAVGIVGANGSGKSTLVKMLARVTAPTDGEIRLSGKIGALLEVGTGFHPELTGKENIYLSGAIIGMKRGEINRCLDQIVDFSGISEFLHLPVKKYSSGMFLRLAFSVMAHLESEILIVDEILAVGDFEFQKKCYKKMDDLMKEGRTILFVSHNLEALLKICPRAIWINQGKLIADGPAQEVISEYRDGKSKLLEYSVNADLE